MSEYLVNDRARHEPENIVLADSPQGEHIGLCLRLILQSHLHQLDAGLTEIKVHALCASLRIREIPSNYEARLALLQVLAAQLLPTAR